MRAMLILLVLLLMPIPGMAEQSAWVMCQPDSKVNIRERASKRSEVVAWGYAGDEIKLDGKKSGKWRHCIIPCETGEGWIREDYISFDPPEDVGTGVYVVTNDKVRARFSADARKGTVRTILDRGDVIHVSMLTAEWCVTDQGFVKTRFLMEVVSGE